MSIRDMLCSVKAEIIDKILYSYASANKGVMNLPGAKIEKNQEAPQV